MCVFNNTIYSDEKMGAENNTKLFSWGNWMRKEEQMQIFPSLI